VRESTNALQDLSSREADGEQERDYFDRPTFQRQAAPIQPTREYRYPLEDPERPKFYGEWAREPSPQRAQRGPQQRRFSLADEVLNGRPSPPRVTSSYVDAEDTDAMIADLKKRTSGRDMREVLRNIDRDDHDGGRGGGGRGYDDGYYRPSFDRRMSHHDDGFGRNPQESMNDYDDFEGRFKQLPRRNFYEDEDRGRKSSSRRSESRNPSYLANDYSRDEDDEYEGNRSRPSFDGRRRSYERNLHSNGFDKGRFGRQPQQRMNFQDEDEDGMRPRERRKTSFEEAGANLRRPQARGRSRSHYEDEETAFERPKKVGDTPLPFGGANRARNTRKTANFVDDDDDDERQPSFTRRPMRRSFQMPDDLSD